MDKNSNTTESREQDVGISSTWQLLNRPNTAPTYGLLRLEAEFSEIHVLQGAQIRATFGGFTQGFAAKDLLITGSSKHRLRVHLMTHLVPNGIQRFESQLILADGTCIRLEDIEFNVQNTGTLAEKVREDLKAFATPPIIGRYIDSKLLPNLQEPSYAWFNRPENISDIPLSLAPAISMEAAHQHLARWGFTVLNHVIPQDLVASFRKEYEDAIDQGKLTYRKGSSQRIHLAHRLSSGRKIWLDQNILAFLSGWFRDEPCACQTLLYINGSEQDAHQDTIHLTSYPDGYMCGVWVALQDVQPGSGELFVYPGSHRTPRVMTADLKLPKVTVDYSSYVTLTTRIHDLLEDKSFERLDYLPKAGEILIWHENLIHGGAKRLYPNRERHSIVSHYFARGSIAYYDSRGEGATLEIVE